MKLSLLRSPDRHVIGIALLFGRDRELMTSIVHEPAGPRPWRLCDRCTENEAIVFCRDHAVYLCDNCLPLHGNRPEICRYISIAVARRLGVMTKFPIGEDIA